MMKNNKGIIFLAVIFFSFFIVLAIPTNPNVFYGTVTLNDDSDVDGTLELYVNNVLQDNISVIDGNFGGPDIWDNKLTATGKNNDTIKFVLVVEDYEIDPITQLYEEGKVEEINLAFEGEKVNITRRELQPRNQTIEGDELKKILDEVSEILQKYNLSDSLDDLEIESQGTSTEISELNQTEIKALANVVDENTLSKLKEVFSSGAKIIVETHSKHYKVRDKNSGKVIHILEIKSVAKLENIEAKDGIVWIEHIPKSIAKDVSFISFKTKPEKIINPDPVVRFAIPYNPEQQVYTIEYRAVTENETAENDIRNIKHMVIPEVKGEEETVSVTSIPSTNETQKLEKSIEQQENQSQKVTKKSKTQIPFMFLILLGLIIALLLVWKLLKQSKKAKK